MRYSFMSFSLPRASLAELVDAAARYGYQGIEPRIGGDHAHGISAESTAGERQEFRRIAESAGIQFACIASGAKFADPADTPAGEEQTRAAIRLAVDLGSTRVRVFGGKFPDGMGREAAIERVATSLTTLAPEAAEHGVILCLETHDAWTTPSHVAEVMRRVDHPAVGVNWDVMHPPRTGGSTLEGAFHELRPWIRHTHVHDSYVRADSLAFAPMGEGGLDHHVVLSLLHGDGYDGWLSGEWINWEPGEVHLPREIDVLKRYEEELATSPT